MRIPVEDDPKSLTAESELLSLGLHEEVLAVSAAGKFSSAQVYFVGPDLWVRSTIFVRLYGRIGGGRLLLSQVALDKATYTQEGGVTTALVVGPRGVPVEGLEVVLSQDDDEGEAVSSGRIVLVASSGDDGAQGAAAPQAGRWPVFLSDGTAEVGSVDNAIHVRKSDRRAAYYTSAVVGTGTASTTNKSMLYVWNNSSAKRAEIRRITIAHLGGTGGNLTVKGSHITAQAGTVGGATVTPLPFDPDDSASAMSSVAAANAPTRVAIAPILFAVPFSATGTFTWAWSDLGKPIVLPAGQGRGFEIRVDVSATASVEMKLHVSMEWLEI